MMLQLVDVVTLYGRSLILHGISLAVDQGEVVALLGRNGAGKTTTLRSIMGLVHPRSGSIRFHDAQLIGRSPHDIAQLGISYVPDDRRIFPDLTVEENLLLAQRAAPDHDGVWSVTDVYELFPVLREYRHRGGTQLSGGEQKMLALGRALVQNPRLILLDEAAEGLAPLIVQEFVRVIREVTASGITILLADQNLKFARRVAQRGYIIDKGQIEYHGDIEDIWANDSIVRQYLAV
jgi:branched-chain amino acid transport system ATP-binding protein